MKNIYLSILLVLALANQGFATTNWPDNPPVKPAVVKQEPVPPEPVEDKPKIVGVGELGKEQPPAPEFVLSGKMVKLQVIGAPKDSRYIWQSMPLYVADEDIQGSVLRFTAKPSKDPFYIRVWVVTSDNIVLLDHSVTISDSPPGPKPPVPNPDDPKPDPNPEPQKESAFRALIVMEMDDVSKLPASQAAALYSGKFYDYLNQTCVKDKNGRPDWRFLDEDLTQAEIDKMEPYWQDAYKKAIADAAAAGKDGKPLYPWVVFSNPAKKDIGEAGPFPDTSEKAEKMAHKWGDK